MTSKKLKKLSENDNMQDSDDNSSDQSDSEQEMEVNNEVNIVYDVLRNAGMDVIHFFLSAGNSNRL